MEARTTMNDVKCILIRKAERSGRRSWKLRWADSQGRPVVLSVAKYLGVKADAVSASMAKTALRRKLAEFGCGKAKRNRIPRATLREFLEADLKRIATDRQPATVKANETSGQRALAAIGADVQVDRVNVAAVDRLKSWLAEPHVIGGRSMPACSKATIKTTLATLKAIWNRGVKRGLVNENPFVDAGGIGSVQPRAKRIFSAAEVAAMVEVAPDCWWRALLWLLWTSGLRIGEALNTQWADLSGGFVVVSAKRRGKFTAGGREYPVLVFSAKSHHERRVPLVKEAKRLLRELRDYHEPPRSRYVFLSLDRLRALEAGPMDLGKQPPANALVNNMGRDFEVIQRKAKALLGGEWEIGSMHDLRKSYASAMARAGGRDGKPLPINELKELMGHAAITTTAAHYLGAGEDATAGAAHVFEAAPAE